ncbi:MAG: threonine ammonia-lyase [Methanoregula sp.]|nr:threonine ammonia-lyase [Methanoregula sp.]
MVSLSDIQAAGRRIEAHIIRTPLIYSPVLSRRTGARIYLKLETLQRAGSFKVRGASNKVLLHLDACRAHGVIAASAGNHAQGVAVAAQGAGVKATIVMPVWASIAKQEATRAYGAEVILSGQTLEEAVADAHARSRDGRLFIHPYDDAEVIAGQGTVALEILHELPETDIIVVPVGGGGLIAGIATAARAIQPGITIIGAQAAACPSAVTALHAGGAVPITAEKTIADGIRVAQTGLLAYPIIRDEVVQIVTATEEEIGDAILLLLERKHVIAEGAGAVPLAALMNGSCTFAPGSTIVLVISGGNVDSALLFRIIRQSMVRQGRIWRFSVILDDQPGALARLLAVTSRQGGNILHIDHEEGASGVPVQMIKVSLELETRGWEHLSNIREALLVAGYQIPEKKGQPYSQPMVL